MSAYLKSYVVHRKPQIIGMSAGNTFILSDSIFIGQNIHTETAGTDAATEFSNLGLPSPQTTKDGECVIFNYNPNLEAGQVALPLKIKPPEGVKLYLRGEVKDHAVDVLTLAVNSVAHIKSDGDIYTADVYVGFV
jgi:hypothetical protein